jgi:glycosyltransferase involved in cell wall biosynthesis
VSNRPTILYAGTYERDYPRNQQMIRLLGKLGWHVIEIHEPFWENFRDKSKLSGRSTALFGLVRLVVIYFRLLVRVVTVIRRVDAVMAGYIGQGDMLVLGPIARIARKPLVFNPLVTLTDTIVEDRALASPDSRIATAIRLIDRLSLNLAQSVISDTDDNAAYMTAHFGIDRSRIHTVVVGADEGVFRHGHIGSGTPGLHVLFYGKMIPLHGIETILSAINMLNAAGDTDISFEIIGSGQQENLVTRALRENPDLPITHRPWVAYPRLAQRIACADVVLGVFGNGEKAGRVIPNKVFQAMAVGAPIITRDSSAVRAVLEHEKSSMLIRPGDPDALANSIRAMRDGELRQQLGAGARAAFERSGTDEATTAQLESALTFYDQSGDRDGIRG